MEIALKRDKRILEHKDELPDDEFRLGVQVGVNSYNWSFCSQQPFKQNFMTRWQAEQLLQRGVGNMGARFRSGQWEAIDALVNQGRRVLVVQRTGWGKSMVYFLATRILRDRRRGPSLIVSPLLALMRNQLVAARRLGLRAQTINSTNRRQWEAIESDLRSGSIDLLLIAPERLSNERFSENVISVLAGRVGMVVIDEAHCISDWGHDFRPDYRRLINVLKRMPSNVPVLGTTATANDRVIGDVKHQLGDILIQRGGLTRKSLGLQTIILPDQASRMAWLAEHIPGLLGTGIVYVLTKRDARAIAKWLNFKDINACAYYSGVEHRDFEDSNHYRQHLEDLFLENKVKVLVATTALGMGYDKPDVGFVIHFQAPSSVVAYYQQVGRAGRALQSAIGVLLSGEEDAQIIEYFRKSAFPEEDLVHGLLDFLIMHNGATVSEIEQGLNLRRGQIFKVLKILSVENPSPVAKVGKAWRRTGVQFKFDRDRIHRLVQQREDEWNEMQDYIRTQSCRMAFLQHALNDPSESACKRCDNCLGRPLIGLEYSRNLVLEVREFLQRLEFSIEPRKQIPSGALPVYGFSGNLPHNLRASEGKVLSRWADSGWGTIVKNEKTMDYFSDELVDAMAKMINERWRPMPNPRWVTCIPSVRNPDLVPSFAKRLAVKLGLQFLDVLSATGKGAPQKEQENSFHQCKNLDEAFAIAGTVPITPAFLVDDIVDSRWTFTIAAALLRRAGSGEVYPVALTSIANS